MRKQKTVGLIFVIALCLAGIWGLKVNMTVWGAVTEVTDIIAPHDIPAVAVKVNEGSEAISEKLSEVCYTVSVSYTHLTLPTILLV